LTLNNHSSFFESFYSINMSFLDNYRDRVAAAGRRAAFETEEANIRFQVSEYHSCSDIEPMTRAYDVIGGRFADRVNVYMQSHTLAQLVHSDNSPVVQALEDIRLVFEDWYDDAFTERRSLHWYLDHLLLEFAYWISRSRSDAFVMCLNWIMKAIAEFTPWDDLCAEIRYDWALGTMLESATVEDNEFAWRVAAALVQEHGGVFAHDEILLYYVCKTPAYSAAARQAQELVVRFVVEHMDSSAYETIFCDDMGRMLAIIDATQQEA
jgi:hypothetical protein